MAPSFDLTTSSGLNQFNDFLVTRSYVEGYQFSPADKDAFCSCPTPSRDSHAHVFRWYLHIAHLIGLPEFAFTIFMDPLFDFPPSFVVPCRFVACRAVATPCENSGEDAKEAEDEDDFDVFGDDEEEEEVTSEEKPMSREERINHHRGEAD